MGTDAERLRRRLYAAGASDADLDAYRNALAAVPPPLALDTAAAPVARRRPGLPVLGAALAVSVVVAAAGVAAAAPDASRPAASPSSSREVLPRPAVRLTSSPQGLTSSFDVQRLIDRVFADQDGVAEDRLTDRVRAAALPDATKRSTLASAGGRSDEDRAVLPTGRGGLEVGTGDVLLLTVVTREPASSTWTVLGWRGGEPHVAHPVVAVLPQVGGSDRLAVAAVRAPEGMTITSLDVHVSPSTPFAYRMELHDVGVCAPVSGPACVSGWRGSDD